MACRQTVDDYEASCDRLHYPARSYLVAFIDRAVALGLGILLGYLLGGCADVPDGHVYECTASVTCGGETYAITPGYACRASFEDARRAFTIRIEELFEQAKCEIEMIDLTCHPGGVCVGVEP